MLLKYQTLIVALFLQYIAIAQNVPPIGNWRDHLPYHQAIAVSGNNPVIYAATPYSVFSIDLEENSINRLSKINGLSEGGIRTIAYEPGADKAIIAYTSSNIDIVHNQTVHNIDALKRSSIDGDKTIHHIFINNNEAFISAGIGILVIDLEKYEVAETYLIGNGGSRTPVYAVALHNNFLYAATHQGLKRAPANGNNLQDFRSWTNVPHFEQKRLTNLVSYNGKLVVQQNDSLYISENSSWKFFFADDFRIENISASNNKLIISEINNQTGRIIALQPDGSIESTISDSKHIINPKQAIRVDNDYWIADSIAGLSYFDGDVFTPYVPNSPASVATGDLRALNGTVWVASGTTTGELQVTNNKSGLYRFNENSWTNFNKFSFPSLDTFSDIVSIAIDPLDNSVWAGSFGGGLANISSSGNIKIYKQNSFINAAISLPQSYQVTGLAFDAQNNLWISNYGAENCIVVRKPDGSSTNFVIPFPIPGNPVTDIVIDEANQKWIILANGNGLLCFNHGASIEDASDDQWKWYRSGSGLGNLPGDNVLSVATDKDGLIWVGTDVGIGVIQCPEQVFSSQGCEAILPVVQQDNFAGYLFRDEIVQCIAIDGANRKWIGTQNGAWLISADAAKTIQRFTETNSVLVSNDVRDIVVEGKSGEVFFSTAKGICSYRGTATETTEENSNVLVFPNPVPPGYTGTIAIRGIPNNSIVKITETNGRLVYQTRATGGQATWNGKDYKGRTISTGIYLVLISHDSKKENLATKIVFISR
jgi:ligand-binding sensor domain-containing protein